MNLSKAIEIQADFLKGIFPVHAPDLPNATKLGIEALKREQGIRVDQKPTQIWLLPGETEE